MLSKLFLLVLLGEFSVSAQTPTYSPVGPDVSPRIAALGKKVRSGDRGAVERFWKEVRKSGAPLIEPIPGEKRDSLVTFLWRGSGETHNVVIFDGVAGFDAKDRMVTLDRTDVWYKTYKIRNDARFAYNLSPNDTLESFDDIKGDDAMNKRLAMLQIDPLNPHRCPATFGAHTAQSSFVELPDAPPLVWNAASTEPQQGTVEITAIQSGILKDEKKVWIYTPPDFSKSGDRYPLLVLFDGDRNVMWVPGILDNLIAKKQIPPIVAILIDNSTPSARRTQLPCDPAFADFLAKELVPWSREKYRTTQEAARTVVAGSSFGGLASVFAGLRHSEVFGNVVSLSGSFWWKPEGEEKGEWLTKQVDVSRRLPLRFYLEVGLMESYPMQIATNRHMRDVLIGKGYPLRYFEYDGGHSFLNWSGGMASSLVFLMGEKSGRLAALPNRH
jgi:enterochelin esterase family protein